MDLNMNLSMDHQTKMLIVDAITNVVKSAPTRQNYNPSIGVTKESFEIWIRYVNTVLQITSQYLISNLTFTVSSQIQNILTKNIDYDRKTFDICEILLNFGKFVLSL